MKREDNAAEEESDWGFYPLPRDALFISTYYWAPMVSKAHKTYFTKELNSAHKQTIHTKEEKIRREECGCTI
jgi:hypothetical protein